MRARLIALISILWLAPAPTAFAADRYTIDPAHSTVGFAVKHLVINRVRGVFTGLSGSMLYDEQDITRSSVTVTIQAASINTQNADRDKHLRSADFFDAATYPDITFTSTRMTPQGDGYVCTGMLTMRGVSKEVIIPFQITGQVKDPWGKTRIGVEAELTLNRQDYGIAWNKVMEGGGFVVGNDVRVTLNVEAIQESPPPPTPP